METRLEISESEKKPTGECFHSFSEFSQTFLRVSIKRLDYDLDISI